MYFILAIAVIVIAVVVFGSRRYSRNEAARLSRSRIVSGKNIGAYDRPAKPFRPATYCEECGRPKGICRREQAAATHWEGMLGPRKKK